MPRQPSPTTPLGYRLAWILETREMTAQGLSLLAGLSPAVVSQLMHGRYEPKGDTVLALAEAGRVEPAWLMWGRGEPELPEAEARHASELAR